MPDLPNRRQRENELAAVLLMLWNSREEIGWDTIMRYHWATPAALIGPLGAVYREAASWLADQEGWTVEPGRIDGAANAWAALHANRLSDALHATTIDIASRATADEIARKGRFSELARKAFTADRAERIAATEVTRAATAGELGLVAYWTTIAPVRLRSIWHTAEDEAVCEVCHSLNGTGREVYGLVSGDGPPVHPNCILPGEMVASLGRFVAGAKSFYVGRCVEITVENGSRISVTENHPILTPAGWIRAKFLNEGSEVLHASDAKRVSLSTDPHYHNRPSEIQEVFCSLVESLGMATARVPVSTEDFHGDGLGVNGDVDVVFPYSLLQRNRASALNKLFGEPSFGRINMQPKTFSCLGGTHDTINWNRLATICGVARIKHGSASRISSRCPSCVHRIRDIARADASKNESPAECLAINACFSGETLLSFPSQVSLQEQVDVRNIRLSQVAETQRLGTSAKSEAGLNQVSSECGMIDSGLAGKFRRRFSSIISSKVVKQTRRFDYSGHVYDLQCEPYGLYSDNGIVVKNCRCWLDWE